MKRRCAVRAGLLVLAVVCAIGAALQRQEGAGMYAKWENGPPTDAGYFPIGVWLQDPGLASRYREAGINLYVGLWKGPTEQQLAELKAAAMQAICAQNDLGLKHRSDSTIIGWMQVDEPDNAQSFEGFWKSDIAAIKKVWPDAPDRTIEQWGSYGPPIPPAQIADLYRKMQAADPTRPVYMNFGQGMVHDYPGRHYRRSHPEDYAQYVKGADIVSFDIYPGNNRKPGIAGSMWLPAEGTKLLRQWSRDERIVWNIIEAAHTTSGSTDKATPDEVRAQVWMALIRGSKGIVYIVHQFTPEFVEAGLFNPAPEDREMLEAVTALNRQIHKLAPVLNSPTVGAGVGVESSNPSVPVEALLKRHGGATYVFAAAFRRGTTRAAFSVPALPEAARAQVLGEGRTLDVVDGRFEDEFGIWGVHLYEITAVQ